MTKQKTFKRRVRERMAKTGESYTAAQRQVAQKRDRVQAAGERPATPADRPAADRPAADRPADEKVEAATGKRWDGWFSILDEWDGREHTHGETVTFLVEEHGVAGWWAQTITVSYQRARGLRLKHQQANGFTVSASKTIDAPAAVLYEAFVDPRTRRRWLPDAAMRLRTSQPGRTARFDWDDGATRVLVSFDAKGPAKTTVAVAHERLADPDDAEQAKLAWRQRLVDLKAFASGDPVVGSKV